MSCGARRQEICLRAPREVRGSVAATTAVGSPAAEVRAAGARASEVGATRGRVAVGGRGRRSRVVLGVGADVALDVVGLLVRGLVVDVRGKGAVGHDLVLGHRGRLTGRIAELVDGRLEPPGPGVVAREPAVAAELDVVVEVRLALLGRGVAALEALLVGVDLDRGPVGAHDADGVRHLCFLSVGMLMHRSNTLQHYYK